MIYSEGRKENAEASNAFNKIFNEERKINFKPNKKNIKINEKSVERGKSARIFFNGLADFLFIQQVARQ